jgi:DHA1 family bicyclomycin/chloramphenicol resistance-like MFS transporter
MPVMLAGRMLQGMGVAGPRIVSTAMVRDCYGGGAMARMMSLVMTIFMAVPIIAPALGQVLLMFGHWRLIFAVLLVIALIGATWLHFGQAETLPLDRRRPLSLRSLRDAAMETVRHPVARGYMLAAGLMFGAFLGYIATSPQIFQEQYGLGELFPLVFACLALFFGSASLINSRLVMRLGMQRLAGGGLIGLSGSAILFLPIALQAGGHPPLWAFMAYLAVTFFSFGVLFGNFNALAMEPLGHIAGMAAGVIGTCITFMAMLLGGVIGSFYDGSVTPVVTGFAILGTLSLFAMLLAERGRRTMTSKPGAAKTSP